MQKNIFKTLLRTMHFNNNEAADQETEFIKLDS